MRVVAVTCVKDEIDIIEAFARHTMAVVNHLVVLDNGSTDGTLEILRALREAGLPLDIEEDPAPGYWQWQRMTRLMRQAVTLRGADWVLPLDADEFLAVPVDRPAVPSALGLERADPAMPLRLAMRTYVPVLTDDGSEPNPVLRIRHRLTNEPWTARLIVPAGLASNGTLDQGHNTLVLNGRPWEHYGRGDLSVAHFPIRSLGQYMTKVAITTLQYLAMSERDPRWAHNTFLKFELLKHDPEAFGSRFWDMAVRYGMAADAPFDPVFAEDPVRYLGGEVVFSPPVDDRWRAYRSLLAYAEDLARRHSRCSCSASPAPASLGSESDTGARLRSGAS
jgi:Glycosyl transferase family 2